MQTLQRCNVNTEKKHT